MDGWMTLVMQWALVWVDSGSWWWTRGSLACCSPWGCKELDTTEQLNWTEQNSDVKEKLHKSKLWRKRKLNLAQVNCLSKSRCQNYIECRCAGETWDGIQGLRWFGSHLHGRESGSYLSEISKDENIREVWRQSLRKTYSEPWERKSNWSRNQ